MKSFASTKVQFAAAPHLHSNCDDWITGTTTDKQTNSWTLAFKQSTVLIPGTKGSFCHLDFVEPHPFVEQMSIRLINSRGLAHGWQLAGYQTLDKGCNIKNARQDNQGSDSLISDRLTDICDSTVALATKNIYT